MGAEQQCIRGSEAWPDATDPRAILSEFYAAFNARDLEQMSLNWSQEASVSMANPLGDVRHGWPDIRAVYEKIFHGAALVFVEFYDFNIQQGADMFVAVGRERGYVEISGQRLDLAIRTSRVYRREESSWRQIHHHGSMDQPELLARYQRVTLEQSIA